MKICESNLEQHQLEDKSNLDIHVLKGLGSVAGLRTHGLWQIRELTLGEPVLSVGWSLLLSVSITMSLPASNPNPFWAWHGGPSKAVLGVMSVREK